MTSEKCVYISTLTSANFELEQLIPVFAGVEDGTVQETTRVVDTDLVSRTRRVTLSLRQNLRGKNVQEDVG